MSKTTTFIILIFKDMPQEVKNAGIEARTEWLRLNPDWTKTKSRAGRWSDAAVARLSSRAGAIRAEAYTSVYSNCRFYDNGDRHTVEV